MGVKNRINPPEHDAAHPDYQRHCQFALEPSVRKLLELAEAAGWDARHVAYAVMALAAGSRQADPAP